MNTLNCIARLCLICFAISVASQVAEASIIVSDIAADSSTMAPATQRSVDDVPEELVTSESDSQASTAATSSGASVSIVFGSVEQGPDVPVLSLTGEAFQYYQFFVPPPPFSTLIRPPITTAS